MLDMYRYVTLRGTGVDITFTNKEDVSSDSMAWLTDLKGWFGGVGVVAADTQRTLGHGLFEAVAQRTGRPITISSELYFQDETARDIADRFLSGLLWDGEYGEIEVMIGDKSQFATVRLDGAIAHSYIGTNGINFQIPLIASDPRIYDAPRYSQIFPAGFGQGLVFPLFTTQQDSSGTPVLDWGKNAPLSAALGNEGNATAYPVITVHGDWPAGFSITESGRSITYPAFVDQSTPVVIDMAEGTVLVGGVDQTYKLTSRDWLDVAPGESIQPRITALAPSTGWADVQLSSTYM